MVLAKKKQGDSNGNSIQTSPLHSGSRWLRLWNSIFRSKKRDNNPGQAIRDFGRSSVELANSNLEFECQLNEADGIVERDEGWAGGGGDKQEGSHRQTLGETRRPRGRLPGSVRQSVGTQIGMSGSLCNAERSGVCYQSSGTCETKCGTAAGNPRKFEGKSHGKLDMTSIRKLSETNDKLEEQLPVIVDLLKAST